MIPLPAASAFDALLQHAEECSGGGEGILDLATELGHFLAERSLTSRETRSIRLALAHRKQDANETLAARCEAIAVLLFAYEASRQNDEAQLDTVNQLGLDAALARLLRRLGQGPATPSVLARGKDNGKVSRQLSRLEEMGLVEPAQATDGRTRPRTLTARGHVVLQRLVRRGKKETREIVRVISVCVESTLRALKSVRVNSLAAPMSRSEVKALIARPLRDHGALDAFECFAESFGFIDIDRNGLFWEAQGNEHSDRWSALLDPLKGDEMLCKQVFSKLPSDQEAILVTVSARLGSWREILSVLNPRIESCTMEAWKHLWKDSESIPIVIVDDSTLAQSLFKQDRQIRVFTIESGAGHPEFRAIQPLP